MNPAVWTSTLEYLGDQAYPLFQASGELEHRLPDIYTEASVIPSSTWIYYWEWLVGYPEHFDQGLVAAFPRLLAEGLDRSVLGLLDDWKWLRDSYDYICGLLRRSGDFPIILPADHEALPYAIAYERAMVLYWHEWAFALGWLGKWIHHRSRLEAAGP